MAGLLMLTNCFVLYELDNIYLKLVHMNGV